MEQATLVRTVENAMTLPLRTRQVAVQHHTSPSVLDKRLFGGRFRLKYMYVHVSAACRRNRDVLPPGQRGTLVPRSRYPVL